MEWGTSEMWNGENLVRRQLGGNSQVPLKHAVQNPHFVTSVERVMSCGPSPVGCYFLDAGSLRSQWRGHNGMCLPRVLRMTPRNMASGLQMRGHSKLRRFRIPLPPLPQVVSAYLGINDR